MASTPSMPGVSADSFGNLKRGRSPSPENVVVILPDESCFEYATPETKKPRAEAKYCWNRVQSDSLIEEFRLHSAELDNPDANRTPIWEKIATNLNAKYGMDANAEHCLSKWRSLKNSYKKVEFSSRSEASKHKWTYYQKMHDILKGVIKEPEPKRGTSFSGPTIFNDTPLLRSSTAGADQATIKIITEPTAVLSTINPTAVQEDLHYPVWFKQFFQVYRKNEETKIALLAKMKSNLTLLAERQCKALEKMNEHLAKMSGNSS